MIDQNLKKLTVLITDDDEFNRQIIDEVLSDKGLKTISATNGQQALDILKQEHEKIGAILLDWMMPVMNGIECLKKIKANQMFSNIPVIMQTAKDGKEDISEGIKSGAYHYLTKPFELETLYAVTKNALVEYNEYIEITTSSSNAEKNIEMGSSLEKEFAFSTINEGYEVLTRIAYFLPGSSSCIYGLKEIVKNAIEHGNLGLYYNEKKRALENDTYEDELERLQNLPENKNKKARLFFKLFDEKIEITITDMGEGFDYEKYLHFDPERVFDPNGRGIAMANERYECELEYVPPGNKVIVRIPLISNIIDKMN